MRNPTPPVFRFAPSPNGALHLGHALSALINQQRAHEAGGRLLLRIEDIDQTRCTPELEEEMLEDLRWLGIEWEEPPRRQSEHFSLYAEALDTLRDAGLVYPAFLSRSEIKKAVEAKVASGETWPRDPDGAPHYPGDERSWPENEQEKHLRSAAQHTWRLNMQAAIKHAGSDIIWREQGSGPDGETGECKARPEHWGDVVLARSDTPTSYHLSVVIDDAEQGITHVVRGQDLFHMTSVHRLLQVLLGLPAPIYEHHRLILGDDGRKLSKSAGDTSLRALREAGTTHADIKRMVQFDDGVTAA